MVQNILAISPLDGRYLDKVNSLASIVSEFGLIRYRVKVEIEWLKLLYDEPLIGLPKLTLEEAQYLDGIVNNFSVSDAKQIKEIEKSTNHDVKAVEYFIKQQLRNWPKLNKYSEFVHFACTSEDINNLSYALMIKDILNKELIPKLESVCTKIKELSNSYSNIAILCRTHGQPATPSTMGKEFFNTYYRLSRQLAQLTKQEILGKINGAVGNYNAHIVSYPEINWQEISKNFVENKLDLIFNPYTTQIEPHDYIVEIMDNLRRINIILIDFARDIWGYISLNYFTQNIVESEIGSSTMPHKINPIDFENGEGNLGIANSLAMHLSEKLPLSRWQRDLTDSTVLRNLGVVFGHSILAYNSIFKGLCKLKINHDMIYADLEDNWELLAEPIQTVMRKNLIDQAYEKLKALTRGKKVTMQSLHDFIQSLDISSADKKRLLNLTPHTYIGIAADLLKQLNNK